MSSNNITKDDENFLKNFLKDFYRQIINLENYTKYKNILPEWIQEFLFDNEKNSEIILKLMENHKENENWFSSLIGFFYEFGIVHNTIDKNKSFDLYLLSINKYEKNENKKLTSMYQLLNIIISKHLLSLYHYKDILYNKYSIAKEFKHLENMNTMSYYQFENFNGLEINLCKDELNNMEKYFELLDKNSIECNINKKELVKLNDLAEGGNLSAQNNLGYCYQNGIGIEKNEKKAFEWYLKAAGKGDIYAQYNLGICYQNGIGINKDDKKAFEWYFKSAKEYSQAQNILGNCYQNEIGVKKDLEESIYWYKKAVENGNKFAQYNLGKCYENGKGVKKDEIKALNYIKNQLNKNLKMHNFNLENVMTKELGTKINRTKAFEMYRNSSRKRA
ncbi:unnamed protein product [Rhizophagus irregularis]|nr:unnamed protein product [Rhizophagus irregularis]